MMASVLAQAYMLSYRQAPYLALALLFTGLVAFVTILVVATSKQTTLNPPFLMLAVLKESRYTLFPAMLLLTESPYTQTILLIAVNSLIILLCLLSVCFYPCFRWARLYLIV